MALAKELSTEEARVLIGMMMMMIVMMMMVNINLITIKIIRTLTEIGHPQLGSVCSRTVL